MGKNNKERREHKRFHSDVEVHFDFIYDLETKVQFGIVKDKEGKPVPVKYKAVSRDISVGGLCLVTHQKTKQGDMVRLDLFLPKSEDPIHMEGKVEWCKPLPQSDKDLLSKDGEDKPVYEVGIRILKLNGRSVDETIHHDQIYDVEWSIVLDAVFGSYRMLMEGVYKTQKE